MFTGIISHVGSVAGILTKENQTYFKISTPHKINQISLGSSIAVDGVCLTVVEFDELSFLAQTMPETLEVTNLKTKIVGSKVNLESPLRLDQGLEGHLVLGHVDGTGKVIRNERITDNNWILEIQPPQDLLKYITQKGSICINGVSLTISKRTNTTFEVSLIDFTIENTNLKYAKADDLINLEVDVIARYLENMITKN